MLSYEKWKTLNESFNVTLGLAAPLSLGIRSSTGATFEQLLDERRKMKKKMLGDRLDVRRDDDDEDETGDGEMVEPTSIKDRLKDDDGDDHGDEHGDDDEDMDDMDHDHDEDDMDHDHDHDHDDDDMGKNRLLSKVQMMKKKMKSKMKKKMCSGSKPKMKKKMAAEQAQEEPVLEDDFLKSLTNMMNGGEAVRYWDGMPKNEDALFPAVDPNASLEKSEPSQAGSEPKAGEVGYAPQGRVGQNW
ncbi:MAG: hypothetical protein ACHQUC_07085 [Chlamydiales bacterium]